MMTRRTHPDGTKGSTDVTRGTENVTGRSLAPIGRRKFLAMGSAGAATLVASAGVAAAVTRAGGPNVSPRSAPPVGLDPGTGREPTAIAPAPGGVRRLALVGTDGWVSMPANTPTVAPYFPDNLADTDKTTYVFGFRNVTGLDQPQVSAQKGHTQISAPLFGVAADSELWVTLTNLGLALRPDLVDSHTLHWHGFRNAIPFYDGVPESSIAVPIGRDFTYVFRPKDAGTYMYHCHFEDVEHVTMGMTGIVYVTPAVTDTVGLTPRFTKKAYGTHDGDGTGETVYDREFAIILTEIDCRAHWNDAHIQTTDWTDFHPEFWLMNGRAYPDTIAPNGTRLASGELSHPDPRLASQPLSSLITCAPGEKVLLRLVNLGFQDHTISMPGISMNVVGRDSRFVPAGARRSATDSIQIGPGESRDIIFTAPADGVYPFFNRDLARFSGSADNLDQWLGGQRSEVRVVTGTAPQLKPNGGPGEAPWVGELPQLSHAPLAPTVSLGNPGNAPVTRVIAPAPLNQRGTFLHGVALADTATLEATTIQTVQYVRRPASNIVDPNVTAPLASDIRGLPIVPGSSVTFDQRVGGGGTGPGGVPVGTKFWVQAIDSLGHKSPWTKFTA